MKSPKQSKQRTINVNGDVIKMKASRVTRQANLMGYNVIVNEHKYFFAALTIDEAFDKAYAKFIKENR